MGWFGERVRAWLGRDGGATVRVHVLIRGRIGAGWYDVDRQVRIPAGTTLGALVERGDDYDLPLAEALAKSPHLAHTLMLNGARCPVGEHRDRPLAEGDELYLLAPIAGG
ncbi:MAG: hypothetical protein Tsb0020_44340 [Haliangiales bacterium]